MTVLDPTAQNWLERGRGNFAQFCLEGFGIKLHPKQIEAAEKVLERGVQYLLLTWANRSGKSTLLMLLHCFALAYKLGMDPPHGRTQAEWNKDFTTRWIPAGYRTLHCAPLNGLSLKAFRELQEILKGTSVAQRDPVTHKRRPAPLAALYEATKVRDDAGADHIILRCATGGVTDFLSTEGGAARLEGEPWWLITWDEWPSTEGGAENARFILDVRLTNRAADFGAPIVLTGTLTDDMEHLAKEWLAKCEDPSNPDWWGNHAARSENPSANLNSISVAERVMDPEDFKRAVLGLAGGVKGRLIPSGLIENCFKNALPQRTAPHEKDGVRRDDSGRCVDIGESPYTYFHLWDIAISQADNVGSVFRLPKDLNFSIARPIEGVCCKFIPGSRTLTDSEIILTIEETFLLYGGQIWIDTSDAHGTNVARELRAKGYPAHDFNFQGRVTPRSPTNKEAGIIALRRFLAEQQDLPSAEQSLSGVHDRDEVPTVDRSKPFGCLKIPATWKKHYDQLSILRPPPDDLRQKKDAAMTVVMLAAVAKRARPSGRIGGQRFVVFGGR